MKAIQILLFLTFWSLLACKNTNSGESTGISGDSRDSSAHSGQTGEGQTPGEIYYSWVDKLRLRKSPDRNAEVIVQIAEGTEITYLNEKTDFTEKITLRRVQYDEPWLKVRSGDKIGWVYGGAVKKEKPRLDTSPSVYDPCFEHLLFSNHDAFFRCKQKVMKAQLKKDARFVTKTNSGYDINLLSGEIRNLVNDLSEGENFRQYEYLYYLEKMGYFVFRVNFFEAGQYLLIDDKFGYSKPIQGFPKPSPDYKNIVAVNADGVAGFEFNGVQILGFTDQGLEILYEKRFDLYEPYLPEWMDEQTIEFKLVPLSVDQRRKTKTAVLKLNEQKTWNLEF